eukprot:CAMPEP_0202338924 /NCGR_PEP_ID=MMETSP1126-20121109/1006_1 /ASSEMBLY_ACC=CAM_ASM_000457 /TAXON_ID=3047 /ORGANISM="Dunaliella tertiolecta, Strain CCMP1320" /LENGTH=43 /DNA_ID= /DNA_START= /DNA_END= /DNA_ORIENTATION=
MAGDLQALVLSAMRASCTVLPGMLKGGTAEDEAGPALDAFTPW